MIDWGDRTGMAPAPVEIAAFLGFDARYLELTRSPRLTDSMAPGHTVGSRACSQIAHSARRISAGRVPAARRAGRIARRFATTRAVGATARTLKGTTG